MISVCIAAHNGESYIKDQIISILYQLGPDDEVIVSDDSSTDMTLSILNSINDSRIKILHHISPQGLQGHIYATLNFENALKASHGDYIFLSDQDDVWVHNKVAVMMKYLEKFSYVVSDCYVTDANLNIISNSRFTPESGITKNKYLAFLKSTPYQGSCAAFRREVLNKALPFPNGIQSHDRWIGFVADFYFSVKIIPNCLIYYRRHEGVASTGAEGKSRDSIWGRLANRFEYIKGLISILNR